MQILLSLLSQFPCRITRSNKVGSDLFEYGGAHYLLVVDYYSKWPCAVQLRSLTSTSVINEMERFFVDFGVPADMVADNGPQYGSVEFRRYCQIKGIRLSTSSPEYPQSNGMAERTVQTVKERLLKMLREGKSLWDALGSIRSTPAAGSLPSPAILLQGRNLRGTLPFSPPALRHQAVDPILVRTQLQENQSTASFQREQPPNARSSILQVGQAVYVCVRRRWIPGTVFQVCPQPASYVVRAFNGRHYRRNRSAINARRSAPVQLLDHAGPTVREPVQLQTTPSVCVSPPVPSTVPAAKPPSPRSPLAATDVGPSQISPDPPPSGGVTRSGRPYLAPPRQ